MNGGGIDIKDPCKPVRLRTGLPVREVGSGSEAAQSCPTL